MFESLRKLIFPIIIAVLVVFVAMIVLDWGLDITGRRRGMDAAVAGSVNGQKISWDAYNRLYKQLYDNESQRSDADIPDSRIRELEQSAWNQIVHDQLLAQEAAKNNIVVTDEELYAYLRMQPPQYLQQASAFQTNGQFDYQKYLQAMQDPQWSSTWAQLEPGIRDEIQRLKMQELIVQTVEVSEVEVKQAFLENTERVRIGLINVPQTRFSTSVPTPTDDQLRQYFDQHKDKYRQDERAVLNVVMLEKKATDEDWNRVGQQMKIIHDSIVAGSSFAEMATAYSQDGSASKGGDLGWFPQGQMVPEFDQHAFAMTEGQISEPFRTQFGWHIMLHQGFRDTSLTAGSPKVRQAHVSHILLRVEPSQESMDASFQRLSDLELEAEKVGFTKAAGEAGLEIQVTTPFTRRGPIQLIGYDIAVDSFAFQNKPGKVSTVMENNSAFYIVEVAQHLPAGDAPFDEVKPRVMQEVRREAVAKACRDLANQVLTSIKGGQSFQAAAQAHGLSYTTTDWLTRTSYQPELGRDPVAISAAFSMNSLGEIVGPVDYSAGAAIMTLLEKQSPELTLYNEKRDSIYNSLMNTKQQEMYSKWFETLLQSSKVENNTIRSNRAS